MRGAIALVAFTVLVTAAFEGCFYFDWDSGLVRGGLVTFILVALLAARALGKRLELVAWPRVALVPPAILVAVLLFWHFKEGVLSAGHERHSEMGDIHARAVPLLLRGITPWHFGTVLDSGAYHGLSGFPEVGACRGASAAPDEAAFDEVWTSGTRSGRELFPARIDETDCAPAKAQLAMAGYRYGPVMLAAYVPLVTMLGPGGVYWTHLLYLLAIIAAMGALARDRGLEALLLACVVLMGQSVLRRDTLLDSDCDLIPTAWLLWALVARTRGRDFTFGALAALTLAAKVFPGAFLLPLLLLGNWRRALGGFVVASVLAWGPAVAADGLGVWDNVVRFNLDRPGDSTALTFFLAPVLVRALQAAVVLLGTWCVVRFVVRRQQAEPLTFVALTMGLFFLATKVFHNNYLVWWLPVVGLVLARALTRPQSE